MTMMINSWWNKLFLAERPSMALAAFRIVVALTTGMHLVPTFVHLEDTYFATGLKTHNLNFFPSWFIGLVTQSPDPLVVFFVALFCLSCFLMLIGLWSQLSCIVMTGCCYYFYALNDFAIGHILTWDILMVTLFLMCLTPYPGDYFSVDALRRGDPQAYRRNRPFFLQRLLQMQIAFTYFYTGLCKITAAGNWFTGNPIHCLMNYPPEGVTKFFLIKDFMAGHPQLCYWSGILIVLIEVAMPVLLFCPATRISAIYLGMVFHVTLILTLDVPSIFFFLFPPMLLLFIAPEDIIRSVEQQRLFHQNNAKPVQLVYDGNCRFCQKNVAALKVMDLFAVLRMVDFQQVGDAEIHPGLSKEAARSQLHLLMPDGTLYGGYFVFRRLCWMLPMMYPLIPVLYFPGSGIVGPQVYRWVAKNRYLFHHNRTCQSNSCFLH